MRLANSRITVDFNATGAIDRIILAGGTVISAAGRQSLLLRTPTAVSEPVLLHQVTMEESPPQTLVLRFGNGSPAWMARLTIKATPEGIHFHLTATAPEPIWLAEWRLEGLEIDSVIVPALGGQELNAEMPDEMTLSYKYPFWWNAQFVIGQVAAGGIWLFSRDEQPNMKLLRVGRSGGNFAWSYGYETPAPFARTIEAEWYIDGFAGDWKRPVERHRGWLEQAFALQPLAQKTSFPAWAEQINFVLEMWGARRDRVEPMHTFAQMAARLEEWQKLHDPAATLVYLPGFAEHGIDSHAPDYHPSPQCGGAVEFARLLDLAHRLGYRVMVHTNVLAMTFDHRLWPQFRQHQVVDGFGRPQSWGLDMDGDWLAEPYFAYINPGVREWGDLMIKVIGELTSQFAIDGLFLDQTLLAFNVSRGPNFIAGMRQHVARLQQAFPQLLFSGEGMHEHLLQPLPMAQIHGLDSLHEIHGMEGELPWRFAHPVSAALFSPFCRFTAHLLTRHPSHPHFRRQEQAYSQLGVIPALCLYNHEQQIDRPEVHAMIARARGLSHTIQNLTPETMR